MSEFTRILFINVISVLSYIFPADGKTHFKIGLKVVQAREVQIYPG